MGERIDGLIGLVILPLWLPVVLAVRIFGGRRAAAKLLGITLEPEARHD